MFDWSYKDAKSISSDIPDSVYTAKISSIQETVSKSSGNPMWVFSFALKELPGVTLRAYQVISGDFDPKTTAIIKSSLAQIAICFSIPEGSKNINDWIGRIGYIKTSHDTQKNGAVFIKPKYLTPAKGRAELFKIMQEKQADDFFANSPSNPPDFNISNNGFSKDITAPGDFIDF